MATWLIDWSLRHRVWVLLAWAASSAIGIFSLLHLKLDAFPDTTPTQIQINTTVQALVPEEIERQVTFPVELAISGLPGLEQVRSISQFGLSQVVVTFADGTDVYFARQLINERLATVELPPEIERPKMGPVSTGLGEVFHYLLVKQPGGGEQDLIHLRIAQDWQVKPALRATRGAAEVNSWGGYEKQYQVRIDPNRLIRHDLLFHDVVEAVLENNLNVGGGSLHRNRAGEMLLVHGIGRTTTVGQIANVVVASENGTPIRVRDVADVAIGHEIRRGLVTADGRGEAVLGLGFMLMGENSYAVTRGFGRKLDDIRARLPSDIEAVVVYDRTNLVDRVIDTVRSNLLDGALLVVIVLFVFLGNLRAGLIVALAIPCSMLFGFPWMVAGGIAGSLLSLGAIDFGIVVDSSVIVVENALRRLAHHSAVESGPIDRLGIVRQAALQVRQPAIFGQWIIMIVYLPILTLGGIEGKMFRPMAQTVMFVLVGSLLASLTLMPVLASLFLPERPLEREPAVVRWAQRLYRPLLETVLRRRLPALAAGAAALVLMVTAGWRLGAEFVPRLSEGSLVIGIMRAPGTDLEESARLNTRMEQMLLAGFPDEIEHVWSRTGAPEVATDPGGVESTDMFVTLRPRGQWQRATGQAELVDAIRDQLDDIPGQTIWFTQPIEQRMNEMISGARCDVVLKLFGESLEVLTAKSRELEHLLQQVPGCADLAVEQIAGQPIMQVRINQDAIARYGVPAQSVLDMVESIGGKPLGQIVEGQLRFPLAVRLPEQYRTRPEVVGKILISTPAGERIPLERLADVRVVSGPRMISREWGERRITLQCNVRGRDIASFVAAAQEKLAAEFELPEGNYRIDWGGQFENLERASRRLAIVVPLALGSILLLLYLTYRNVVETLLVFTSVPFACVGGVLSLWLRGMPFSISAAIGFITLAGVSVLNTMVFVNRARELEHEGLPHLQSIVEAKVSRLRTVLMTALVACLGFVPMATSDGVGAEVQRPLATVVIGGVAFATLVDLLLIPVFFSLFRREMTNAE